jgi:hypothetical protein
VFPRRERPYRSKTLVQDRDVESRQGAHGSVRVRSTTVRVRDQFVLARYGRVSQARYREHASPSLLETLTTPGDRWVEFAQFVEATELVCKLFAEGDRALAREIGGYGAEVNIGRWRAVVFRVMSPQTVLQMASGLWSHHYDGGRLAVAPEGQHGVRVRIESFPTPHLVHCLSVEGWFQRTIELGRPKHVTVQKTACRLDGADACEYVGEWE